MFRPTLCFVAVMLAVVLPAVAGAQPSAADQLYTVTLRQDAAADAPEVVATSVAAAHGATVTAVAEGAVTMRLSPTRVAVVAADPRVATIVPASGGAASRGAAVAAETMTWSTGVAYQYDGSGNVRKIGPDIFVYDEVGRLVQGDANGVRRNYEYDRYGNRTGCVQSEGTAEESDCQFDYTVEAETNRLDGLTYDAAGNVTSLGAHVYTYDALNMQTRDTWAGLAREYVYTADDERLAISDGSTWRWTVRDTSGKVLREFTSAGGAFGTANWAWSKDHIWRNGLLLASRQFEPGGSTPVTYHDHLDHLGTPRRITDATDRIIGVHDYHAFGPEVSGGQNEPSLSLMKFTGHERDIVGSEAWDTLDYMHARYASGTLGRFLSVDPARSADPTTPQTWNRYAYSRNNPLRYVDPDGRSERDVMSVRVNVIFSNADRQISSNGTMRQIVERGITEARGIYNNAGIALDVRRHESDLTPSRFHRGASGSVQTGAGRVGVSDFLASQNGAINLVFMGDLNKGSSTDGPGTPALFGVQIDADNVAHEMAHQLGNVLPVTGILANTLSDIIYSAEILQMQMGIGFSPTFEGWLRDEAARLNPCPQGDGSCD